MAHYRFVNIYSSTDSKSMQRAKIDEATFLNSKTMELRFNKMEQLFNYNCY